MRIQHAVTRHGVMRGVALTCMTALMACVTARAAAHPPTSSVVLVTIAPPDHVVCRIVLDPLAIMLGQPSQTILDSDIDALLARSDAELDTALRRGETNLLAATALIADGQRVMAECTAAPTVHDVRAWQSLRRGNAAPCEMPMELRAQLPPTARRFAVRCAPELGNTLLAIDRPGTPRVVFPLEAGDESPPVDVTGLQAGAADAPAHGAAPAQPDSDRVQAFVRFIRLGFLHIVPEGLDHALFVLGLFLLTPFVRPLLWQVTAFTVAHSITLTLAVLGLVRVPAEVVEPAIALSIVCIAVENLFSRGVHPWRLAVIFVFGLLHGLGFASGLVDVGVPAPQLVTGIVGFSVGVELGHLAVLALAFALLGWTRGKPWYRSRVLVPCSCAIAAVAGWWFIERAAGAIVRWTGHASSAP